MEKLSTIVLIPELRIWRQFRPKYDIKLLKLELPLDIPSLTSTWCDCSDTSGPHSSKKIITLPWRLLMVLCRTTKEHHQQRVSKLYILTNLKTKSSLCDEFQNSRNSNNGNLPNLSVRTLLGDNKMHRWIFFEIMLFFWSPLALCCICKCR